MADVAAEATRMWRELSRSVSGMTNSAEAANPAWNAEKTTPAWVLLIPHSSWMKGSAAT